MNNNTLTTTLLAVLLSANIQATDIHGNDFSTAANIGINSNTNAAIDAWNDSDYFKVSVPSKGRLEIKSSYLGGSDITDTKAWLYNSGRGQVAFNRDGKVDENFLISEILNSGTYYIHVKGENFDSGAYRLNVKFSPATATQKIVILAHGMNSGPETWSKLIKNKFSNSCTTVTPYDVIYTNKFNPNSKSINGEKVCYNIEFGYFDHETKRAGLLNKPCEVVDCHGDYSSISELGIELDYFVNVISKMYSDKTEIALIGHSRGGLAIRAFLQKPNLTNVNRIKAVITTGTPHKGSPLGRSYQYMKDNCMPKTSGLCKKDWQLLDNLKPFIDLTTPTINNLSPDNSEMIALHAGLNKLPLHIDYTQVVNKGVKLGILHTVLGISTINIWHSNLNNPYAASENIRSYILQGANYNLQDGDGIVPADSQRFGDINEYIETGKTHISETSNESLPTQVNDMYLRINW